MNIEGSSKYLLEIYQKLINDDICCFRSRRRRAREAQGVTDHFDGLSTDDEQNKSENIKLNMEKGMQLTIYPTVSPSLLLCVGVGVRGSLFLNLLIVIYKHTHTEAGVSIHAFVSLIIWAPTLKHVDFTVYVCT